MKTVSSTEFRRVYATLAEPVVVTALGRQIGVWYPGVGPRGYEPVTPVSQGLQSSRPFTPAPKPGKKR